MIFKVKLLSNRWSDLQNFNCQWSVCLPSFILAWSELCLGTLKFEIRPQRLGCIAYLAVHKLAPLGVLFWYPSIKRALFRYPFCLGAVNGC